jgi:hypothetical protein
LARDNCLASRADCEPTEVRLLASIAKHRLGVGPAEPGDEVDRAGITAFRDTTSLQPARQLILVDYEAVGTVKSNQRLCAISGSCLFFLRQQREASGVQGPAMRPLVEARRLRHACRDAWSSTPVCQRLGDALDYSGFGPCPLTPTLSPAGRGRRRAVAGPGIQIRRVAHSLRTSCGDTGLSPGIDQATS